MGIDAKCIGGFLWKVTRVSMNFCYKCVKKHPNVSGVLLVLFLLFMFLPSVFYFLIYASPIVGLVTVSIQIYLKINRYKAQNGKKNEEKPSSVVESKPVAVNRKGEKPLIHKQLSRRRNFKQNIESDNDASSDGSQKVVTEEKGLLDGGESSSLKAFNAQSVQAQGDLVGLNEGRSDAFFAEKGIGLSDGGEIAGLVTSAARNVGAVHDDLMGKTSLNASQTSSAAQNVQAVIDDLKGKTSLNEDKSKGIVEEKGNYSLEQGESSSRNIQALDQPSSSLLSHDGSIQQSGKFSAAGGSGGEAEVESSDGEDDEEEARQDGNKAVEWTEDDQQNLMDLGDSELERNKRLESLIAKRRARKLFKMAIEKRLMDSGHAGVMPIPPILTLKNNLLTVVNNSLDESLPMPGSAPSILLPGRNPFDLPYDPMEEKPNLMADSFQQEFMAQQKDQLFCRHESFCLGPSSLSESQKDQNDSRFGPYGNEKKNEEGHRFSKFRSQSFMSSHDQLIDELLFQEDESLSRNVSATDLVDLEDKASKSDSVEDKDIENQKNGKGRTRTKEESMESMHDMETDSAKDNSTDQCSVASSEASELSFSSNIPTNIEILEAKVGKFPQRLTDRVQSALTFQVPNSSSFDGSSYDKPRLTERLLYRERSGPCHSPGYSIASDLQVEVSEIGSPPFTVDGTASPADAESLCDGDIDKGSEEMWGTPCHVAGVEENEFRSREMNEVNEDDIVEVKFSAIKQDLEDPPVASSKLPEVVAAKDLPPDNYQTNSENLDTEVPENVTQLSEEVQKSSQSSYALSSENPEEAILLMKDSATHPPHDVHSDQKPEEPLEFPEKSAEEVNVSNNGGDQVVDANDDKDKLESIENRDGSAQILINQEAIEDPSQSIEISTSESNQYTDNNSDKSAQNQSVTELERRIEDILNPETTEEDTGKINEQDDIEGTSKTFEEIDNLMSVQDGEDKQSITEAGVNQRFDNPTTSAIQPELDAEQIPANSSSSSSPRSVLPGNIPIDQIPSSSYDQLVHHIDVPRSIVDDIFRNNSLDDESSEGLTHTASQNLQQLLDPTDHLISTNTDLGKSEEPSIKVVEGRSESSINPAAATELSEPADITHPGYVDHIKGKSPILLELEAGIIPEKTAENIANPENVPETMSKEEETSNSQEESTREANVDNITNPVVNEKEDEEKLESVEHSQGQSEIDIEISELDGGVDELTTSESIEDRDENNEKLTENEVTIGPSQEIDGNESLSISTGSENIIHLTKPVSSEDSLEIIEDSQDELATAETASRKEELNLAEDDEGKSNVANNIDYPVNNGKEDLEKLKPGQDSEGESHISMTEAKDDEGKSNVADNIEDPVNNGKEDLKPGQDSEGESHISMTEATQEKLNLAEDDEGKSSVADNIEDPVNNEKELRPGQDSEGESHISMTEATEEQLKAADTTTSKSIEDGKENEGGLTDTEATAVLSNSVDGNESLNVIKGSEDVKDLPVQAKSESSLEAVEDSQGDSEKSENEHAMKLSVPASETVEEKESSSPLQQKSEEEVDIIHKVNETAANEMSNNQNLIQQENAANQPTLDESNDSLKTAKVIESEKQDSDEDDVNKAESTNHSTKEESKPVESEVKASEQETNTAV